MARKQARSGSGESQVAVAERPASESVVVDAGQEQRLCHGVTIMVQDVVPGRAQMSVCSDGPLVFSRGVRHRTGEIFPAEDGRLLEVKPDPTNGEGLPSCSFLMRVLPATRQVAFAPT